MSKAYYVCVRTFSKPSAAVSTSRSKVQTGGTGTVSIVLAIIATNTEVPEEIVHVFCGAVPPKLRISFLVRNLLTCFD